MTLAQAIVLASTLSTSFILCLHIFTLVGLHHSVRKETHPALHRMVMRQNLRALYVMIAAFLISLSLFLVKFL